MLIMFACLYVNLVSKVGHLLCFVGNVTVGRLFLKGNDMKLSSLSSLGLAALLLAGTATAASALDFNFSFSTDCAPEGTCSFGIPGTVTGEITGLKDNATSAATHVWINSIVGPLDFSPGLTTPFETFTSSDYNSFTVSGGKITEAFCIAGSLGAGFLFDLIDLSVGPQNSLEGLGPLGPSGILAAWRG
jgi:hypothetical protein